MARPEGGVLGSRRVDVAVVVVLVVVVVVVVVVVKKRKKDSSAKIRASSGSHQSRAYHPDLPSRDRRT